MCGIAGVILASGIPNTTCVYQDDLRSSVALGTTESHGVDIEEKEGMRCVSIESSEAPKAKASCELFEALGVMQHRGQDAAGIITCAEKGRMYQCKGNGLVRDVFTREKLASLEGYMGVGHVRYPTAGTSSTSEAQPFYVNSPYGVVLAHNGNLTNAKELKHYLDYTAHRHINTDSDSEVLLNILADSLQRQGKTRINQTDIFNAVEELLEKCRGGYACVAMIAGVGLIAFRDPQGIRPCIFGKRSSLGSNENFSTAPCDYMVASESAALDALEFSIVSDIGPGEAIFFPRSGKDPVRRVLRNSGIHTPCIFEYVYFARQDSIIDGACVYSTRLQMGKLLASRIQSIRDDIDVVIPVPDTARAAALEVARALDKPFREGFNKNRYVGRTFIMPGQRMRKDNVRRKLNPMRAEFCDKRVLLVDDSIVRGTTSREIVAMVRRAGARSVIFASCAPAIRHVNVYGIDIPTRRELVAHNVANDNEIATLIGADMVVFLPLEDLVSAVTACNPSLTQFECSVFDGKYVTGDISEEYIRALEARRNEIRGISEDPNTETIGLHNSFKTGK